MSSIPTYNGIPALGLGTYPLSGAQCADTVKLAIELGYRHIDTAQMYGNERDVGNAIANCGLGRSELFITTKVDPSNLSKMRFADSMKKSMENLGGPADLLLIHWPPADSDMDATLDHLKAAQDKGMTRHIGVSNFNSAMLRQAVRRLGHEVTCNQVEFHPLLDQGSLKATADELGLPLVAYSPIARGRALEISAVKTISARLNRPPSEIVLRWIVQQGVVAIPMSTKHKNLASNFRIFDFTLSEQDMATISTLGSRSGRTIAPSSMTGRWDG